MDSTGCPHCDAEQERTGDPTAVCLQCEKEALDRVIVAAMNRIEEIKHLQENQNANSR